MLPMSIVNRQIQVHFQLNCPHPKVGLLTPARFAVWQKNWPELQATDDGKVYCSYCANIQDLGPYTMAPGNRWLNGVMVSVDAVAVNELRLIQNNTANVAKVNFVIVGCTFYNVDEIVLAKMLLFEFAETESDLSVHCVQWQQADNKRDWILKTSWTFRANWMLRKWNCLLLRRWILKEVRRFIRYNRLSLLVPHMCLQMIKMMTVTQW